MRFLANAIFSRSQKQHKARTLCMYCSQKLGEDFAKFSGLLRIYELYTFRLVQVMFINLLLYIQGQFLTIACSQQVRTTLFPIYLLHTYTVSSSRLIWTIANESKISHSRSAMPNRNITFCQAKLPQNQSYTYIPSTINPQMNLVCCCFRAVLKISAFY